MSPMTSLINGVYRKKTFKNIQLRGAGGNGHKGILSASLMLQLGLHAHIYAHLPLIMERSFYFFYKLHMKEFIIRLILISDKTLEGNKQIK